jgi:hypothetical protein
MVRNLFGTNYIFLGWTMTVDPSDIGVELNATTTAIINSTVTSIVPTTADFTAGEPTTYNMYAVWAIDQNNEGQPDYLEKKYSIVYNGNGNTSGTIPPTVTNRLSGMSYYLAGNPGVLEKTGCLFLGWSKTQTANITTAAEEAKANIILDVNLNSDDISILSPADILTVYAVWAADINDNDIPDYEEKYSLTYNLNGGDAGTGPVPNPATNVPVKKGYVLDTTKPTHADDAVTGDRIVFIGWTEEPDANIYSEEDQAPVTVTTVDILGDVTVYAVWGYALVIEPDPSVPPVSKTYYITPSADSNSTISPDAKVAVSGGNDVTFTFSAKTGYHVASVTIDGIPLSQAQIDSGYYTFRNVVMNHTIEVKSSVGGDQRADITLTINVKEGEGNAEYKIGNGQFTKYAGIVTIPTSSNVTVKATADEGYSFEKWVHGTTTYTASEKTFSNVTTSISLDLYFKEGSDDGGWAILNLVCAILALIIGIVAIAAGMKRYSKGNEEKRSKVALIQRILAFVIGIISIIIFLHTADLNLSMIVSDDMTIIMAVLLMLTVILAAVSFRFDTKD